MDKSEAKILPCPRCGEPVTWNKDAKWKPFCSERCRLIDLGAWFAEEHTIPGEPALADDANNPNTRSDNDD